MKILIASLMALSLLACGSNSETTKPDQPPVASPPADEQPPPPADEQPPADDSAACVKSGCSGTLCVEAGNEMVTTCEWKPEYECYQSATCERQTDGSCGFSDQAAIEACVAAKSGG